MLISISETLKHPSPIHISMVFVVTSPLIDPGTARNTPNVASLDVPETSRRHSDCTTHIQASLDTSNGAVPKLTVGKLFDVDTAHSMTCYYFRVME